MQISIEGKAYQADVRTGVLVLLKADDVIVNGRGVFVLEGDQPLTTREAVQLGARLAKSSPAQAATLRRAGYRL
jgi:hypothetical protein